MSDDLLNLGLPKWPQMMVTGKHVTLEQAKEIIFRTDPFLVDTSKYSGGNAHEFNAWYRKEAGLDLFEGSKTSRPCGSYGLHCINAAGISL